MCHVYTNIGSLCIKTHIFNSLSEELEAAGVAASVGSQPERL